MGSFPAFIGLLLGNSPTIIASFVGIIVAAVCWQRAPRASMLLLIASVANLLLAMINVWLYGVYIPQLPAETRFASVQMIGIWGAVAGVLHGVAYALMIWAIYAGRPPAMPRARP
jgi:uncharacterized membrane protein YoaK (UPF0700 family)